MSEREEQRREMAIFHLGEALGHLLTVRARLLRTSETEESFQAALLALKRAARDLGVTLWDGELEQPAKEGRKG